jgi:hypothetical protein
MAGMKAGAGLNVTWNYNGEAQSLCGVEKTTAYSDMGVLVIRVIFGLDLRLDFFSNRVLNSHRS